MHISSALTQCLKWVAILSIWTMAIQLASPALLRLQGTTSDHSPLVRVKTSKAPAFENTDEPIRTFETGGSPVSVHPQKRIALVHIGPFKTASTSIQDDICRYANDLAALNWTVPYCAQCSCTPAHGLGKLILGIHSPPETHNMCLASNHGDCFAKAITGAPKHNSVLFSSEFFVMLSKDPDYIEMLAEILRDFHVKIVYVHRGKASQLLSQCNQQAKDGPGRTFERCVLNTIGSSGDPNFRPEMLEAYADAFGPKNIYLMSLERIVQSGVTPFRALIEIEPSLRAIKTNENTVSNSHLANSAAQLINLFQNQLKAKNNWVNPWDHVGKDCLKKRLVKFTDSTSLPTWCIDMKHMLESWIKSDFEWCKGAGYTHHYFECEDMLREGDTYCFVDIDAIMANQKSLNQLMEEVDGVQRFCSKTKPKVAIEDGV